MAADRGKEKTLGKKSKKKTACRRFKSRIEKTFMISKAA